jgi:N-acetyl-gamma-glutamyl-phosphate reductase
MGERIGIVRRTWTRRGGADPSGRVHPRFDLGFVSSRELSGQRVADHLGRGRRRPALQRAGTFRAATIQRRCDRARVCPTARPPNASLDSTKIGQTPVLLDLIGGLPFRFALALRSSRTGARSRGAGIVRISNPGCYATAMQLAIAPMRDLLDGPFNASVSPGIPARGRALGAQQPANCFATT